MSEGDCFAACKNHCKSKRCDQAMKVVHVQCATNPVTGVVYFVYVSAMSEKIMPSDTQANIFSILNLML